MDYKQNFYLKSMNAINILKGKNKTEYITTALAHANNYYRAFVQFTRKRLNPKTSKDSKLTLSDLIVSGKLKNNTLFNLSGITAFAARGTKAQTNGKTINIDGMEFLIASDLYKIKIIQSDNDFNDDEACTEVVWGENDEE